MKLREVLQNLEEGSYMLEGLSHPWGHYRHLQINKDYDWNRKNFGWTYTIHTDLGAGAWVVPQYINTMTDTRGCGHHVVFKTFKGMIRNLLKTLGEHAELQYDGNITQLKTWEGKY